MRIITRLKREAIDSCRFRGHRMGKWEILDYNGFNKMVCASRCKNCNMEVVVDTKPLPNGIDIGGKAVALNCK